MTAWDLFWLLFIFIPLTIIWIFILADVIKRPDILGLEKGIWVAVIIFFPWLGALAYLIFRSASSVTTQQVGGVSQVPTGQASQPGTQAPSAAQTAPTPS